MKKKRIRKIVLASILAVFIVGGLYTLSIEPSDYKETISKHVKEANTLLKEANVGNDEGDYSKDTIIKMKNSIKEAKALIEEEAPVIDKLREQDKKIKEDIKKFKNSYNKNCLSKEDVRKLKEEKKSFSEEINLDNNKKVEWQISGRNIKKIEPINLDIEIDTVHKSSIKQIAKDNNMDISILSFRHNGKLPLKSRIKIQSSLDKGKKYLYKYDENSNQLIYESELKFKNDRTVLNIDQGGDWILSNVKIELAKDNKTKEKDKKEDDHKSSKDKEENSEEDDDKSNVVDFEENKNNVDKKDKNEVSTNEDKNTNNNTDKLTTNKRDTQSNSPNSGGSQKKYCTIEIRCDTILSNMDRLPKGKEGYIPKNGVILAPTKIEIKEGENVFDVLKRVTRSKGIQMEFRNDPLYSGAYVEGINHLYEFDGGELSGWMYKVNGWFPNYGCSQYYVKENDYISWNYTCNLGKDVGDQDYWKYNNE